MKDKKYYIQVVASMIGALLLSFVLITVFFPTKSPDIRPNLTAYISEATGNIVSNAGSLVPRFALPSFDLFTRIAPEQNSTSVSTAALPTSGDITPEQSAIAAGVRQQLATQKLALSSPGIYTTSNEFSRLTVLKQNEVSWSQVSLSVKGKTVIIRVPPGQTPPTVDLLEKISNN